MRTAWGVTKGGGAANIITHCYTYVRTPVSDCEDLYDIVGSRFSSNLPSPEYNLVSNQKNIAESTTLDSCMGCFVDQYQV